MSAEFTCPKCGTEMVVVPPEIGSFKRPEDAPAIVTPTQVPEGQTRVDTDETGKFSCPNPDCDYTGDYESIGKA